MTNTINIVICADAVMIYHLLELMSLFEEVYGTASVPVTCRRRSVAARCCATAE